METRNTASNLPCLITGGPNAPIWVSSKVVSALDYAKVELPAGCNSCGSLPDGYILYVDKSGAYYMRPDESSQEFIQLEVPPSFTIGILPVSDRTNKAILCIKNENNNKKDNPLRIYYGVDGRIVHHIKDKNNNTYGFYGERLLLNDGTGKYVPCNAGLYIVRNNSINSGPPLPLSKSDKNKVISIGERKFIQISMGFATGLYLEISTTESMYYNPANIQEGFSYFYVEDNQNPNNQKLAPQNYKKESNDIFSEFGGGFLSVFNDNAPGQAITVHTELFKRNDGQYFIWTGEDFITMKAAIELYNTAIMKNTKILAINKMDYRWGKVQKTLGYYGGYIIFFEHKPITLPDGTTMSIWKELDWHLPESRIDEKGDLMLVPSNDVLTPELTPIDTKGYYFFDPEVNKSGEKILKYRPSHFLDENGQVVVIKTASWEWMYPIPGTHRFRKASPTGEDAGYRDGLFYGARAWSMENISGNDSGNFVLLENDAPKIFHFMDCDFILRLKLDRTKKINKVSIYKKTATNSKFQLFILNEEEKVFLNKALTEFGFTGDFNDLFDITEGSANYKSIE